MMSSALASDILQGIGWFLALLELIMALYVLALNPWHTANRHMSAVLGFFMINSFALGLLIHTADVNQANLAATLLSLTTEGVKAGLLLLTVVLLRPEWLAGRWRWAWRLLYGLIALPILLTMIDRVWGTGLWYTGLDPQTYAGGYVENVVYLQGGWFAFLRPVYVYGVTTFTLLVQLYLVFVDKAFAPTRRRLAWLFLGTQALVFIVLFLLRDSFGQAFSIILSDMLFAVVYTYAAFQQMVSERRLQRGRLRLRLTVLTLAIAAPTLCAGLLFVNLQARALVLERALAELAANNRTLAVNMTLWLDDHTKFLQQLAQHPQIVTMDAQKQLSLLTPLAEIYPDLTMICALNRQGRPLACSEGQTVADYSNYRWFLEAREGASVTSQAFYRIVGRPALALAVPIRLPAGDVVGVMMLAIDLPTLGDALRLPELSQVDQLYVVDAQNQVIVHSDLAYMAELRDFSETAPVSALRDGVQGAFDFADAEDRAWASHLTLLDNDWGVISQQNAAALSAPLRRLSGFTILVLTCGLALLIGLTFFTIRQGFTPVATLTDTARAIVAGDLTRVAPVETEDELGVLARTFNRMTEQLREAIGDLEQRVAARTHDLERRSHYLEATAEVGQAVASILDREQLLRQVVNLIQERFALYYVGLFLVDAAGEWAVLQAGTGDAGRAMLARQYRIHLGQGMIGWCAANGQARVASRTEADFVWLPNPDLPDTRSEAALPLISRGRVLGVMSVQNNQVDTFDADTVTVLQTVADLVAVALDNARLFAEAQEALAAERRVYGARARAAWADLTRTHLGLGYRCAPQGPGGDPALTPLSADWDAETQQAHRTGQTAQRATATGSILAIPVRSSNQVIGVLRFEKAEAGARWSSEETALLETLSDQLGQTLERAQLYQETQRRAVRERLTREITDEMRRTLTWDELMQVAVQEMGAVLNASRAFVQWTATDTAIPGTRPLKDEEHYG